MIIKKGALCRLKCDDYGWYSTDILRQSKYSDIYTKYTPLIKPHTAKTEMIVEVQHEPKFVGHVAVWVPELNGYTFMFPVDLEPISK